MKILFLSDTHGHHQKLSRLPTADILIHSGDVSQSGADHEIEDFIKWLEKWDYHHKIFIAGNHDFYFQRETINRIQRMLSENTHYLCDNGVTIEGINIWGSPITPIYHNRNWAFNRNRGKAITKHWNKIPKNTDVLITHGPPLGILDRTTAGLNVGCEDLFKKVISIKPRYHLFGHLHEAYGIYESLHTTYINGCLLNENDELVNQPVVINI